MSTVPPLEPVRLSAETLEWFEMSSAVMSDIALTVPGLVEGTEVLDHHRK